MTNYTETDQYLHVLSQILAKINRSLVKSEVDDSHTSLAYVSENKRIYTHWFVTPKGKFIAFIDLINQTFRLQGEVALKPIPWDGKTIFEIESELGVQLNKLGVSKDSVFSPMHYEIPEYNIPKKLKPLSNEEIDTWHESRALANAAAQEIASKLELKSEPRIWPHHFDTGIYIEPRQDIGLGFGLAMEDKIAGAPYFYLSCYKQEGIAELDNLPVLPKGNWEVSDNWKGAFLPITSLSSGTEHQLEEIGNFAEEALKFYIPAEV